MFYTYEATHYNSNTVISKNFSFAPSDYRYIKNNTHTKKIKNIIDFEFVGEQIDTTYYITQLKTSYKLITIQNMNNILLDIENGGEYIYQNIFDKSSKKILKHDLLISRNASLGKISYNNEDSNIILNGGISLLRINNKTDRFYIMAFFISKYGEEYLKVKTSSGGTQQNAKREDLLSMDIPFSEQLEVQKLVSLITQNIIDKEQQIREKNKKINSIIQEELETHSNIHINYPMSNEIKESDFRFDTGLYSKEYKLIKLAIETYKHGFFKLKEMGILKSGNTPSDRVIRDKKINKFLVRWFTPTIIDRHGILNKIEYICNIENKYNLNTNSILFINRGSENDLGINYLYINEDKSQHNQGLYRLEFNKLTNKIIFISAIFNSTIYRKYIGKQGLGSKMKEIKKIQLEETLIPDFPEDLQEKIAKEYFNKIKKNEDLTFDTYLEKEKQRNSELGIWQLNMEIFELKEKLEDLIGNIVHGKEVEIVNYL